MYLSTSLSESTNPRVPGGGRLSGRPTSRHGKSWLDYTITVDSFGCSQAGDDDKLECAIELILEVK